MTPGGSSIRVPVRLFARYAELLGTERLTLSLAAPATVDDVLRQLRAEHPAAAAFGRRPLVAIGLRQVPLDAAVEPGDEVAILPPLSGG